MEQEAIKSEIIKRLEILHINQDAIHTFSQNENLLVMDIDKNIIEFEYEYSLLARAMNYFESQLNIDDKVYFIEEGEMGENADHVLVFYLFSKFTTRWEMERDYLKNEGGTMAYLYFSEDEEMSCLVDFRSDLWNSSQVGEA